MGRGTKKGERKEWKGKKMVGGKMGTKLVYWGEVLKGEEENEKKELRYITYSYKFPLMIVINMYVKYVLIRIN